jgi:hypothetical protein
MKTRIFATACCILLCSCSNTSVKESPKQPEPPPEPATGRRAFQDMYPMVRTWSMDALPVQLQSINLAQVKSGPGTAGAWQATFFSTTSGKTKMYTWSAIESEGNLHKGVFAGPEESSSAKKTFPIAALRIDSDEAYKVALSKSADYVKKHPNMPVLYILEMTNRFPQLAWRVVWGESLAISDYSVFVDAATGEFLERAH